MSDSEDYYFDLDSDMEDTEIEKFLEKKEDNKQIDTFLAYTTQRMFHGGGTPPNASDKPTIPQMQVLFQQPKILGVKCPIRSASNLAREKRNEESKKFNEFFETLTKETYTLEELTTKYNEHFPEAFIEPRALSQMKCIKKFFISIHKQKRLKGQSKKIDFRLYQKRKF